MTRDGLAEYYARRASEYDRIYMKPERQADIGDLASRLAEILAGRTILELACGTGFWTQFLAPRAASILATDINPEMLEIARRRLHGSPNVSFQRADALTLRDVGGGYTGCLAAFWWSHLRKDRVRSFLEVLHSRLAPGARVVFADNVYVEGSSTPISRTDADGNTYQMRRLMDGSGHEVLKNFPSESEFLRATGEFGRGGRFCTLKYFWYGWYELPE
jgi:demethylmenaquinone methyltransferase/2-methoxy-6-polyprenyl-1,4-benzoquinol methylase